MSAQAMCTCKNLVNGTPHKVPVVDGDKCGLCGYYVMWFSDYKLYPKSNKGIGGYVKVTSNRVPGKGWNQEKIINYFEDIPGGYIGNDEAKSIEDNHFKFYTKEKEYDKSSWNTPTRRQLRESEFKKENEE